MVKEATIPREVKTAKRLSRERWFELQKMMGLILSMMDHRGISPKEQRVVLFWARNAVGYRQRYRRKEADRLVDEWKDRVVGS